MFERTIRILTLSGICTLLGACIPVTDTPAEPQLDFDTYANSCQKSLEKGAGEIKFPPVLHCLDGQVLSITRNGIEVPANSQQDAKNFGARKNCDNPAALVLGDEGQCVPNSRLSISHVAQEGLTDKKRPTYALLCRNYRYRPLNLNDGGFNKDPQYDDIALVIYSPNNKNTCFFQRLGDTESQARGTESIVDSSISFSPQTAIAGKDVPSPFSPEGKNFWATPLEMKDNLVCSSCHDANPFIRTPYITQLKSSAPLGGTWFPSRRRTDAYNIVELDYFGEEWKLNHARFDLAPRKNGDIGKCVSCHSVGPGYSSGLLTEISTGTRADNQKLPADKDAAWMATHWMPPQANESDWIKNYMSSVEALKSCHEDNSQKTCQKRNLH